LSFTDYAIVFILTLSSPEDHAVLLRRLAAQQVQIVVVGCRAAQQPNAVLQAMSSVPAPARRQQNRSKVRATAFVIVALEQAMSSPLDLARRQQNRSKQ
jgi:tRNA A37 methylthiotransferase MiaB